MKDFDFEKFCKESDQRQKEWDALPEVEKEKRRKSLAGWADRIEAENEAFGMQVENELKAMTPEERREREELIKQMEQERKKPD
ncbi:MAG: hypothetical protein R6U66_07360 [Bacteroidales bacterium]